MSIKRDAIEDVLRREGGYVNDPNDSGGETNYGITVATARAAGYSGDMVDLPRGLAHDIYARQYWDAIAGDQVEALSEAVVSKLIDAAVNISPRRTVRFLQRSLNVLNVGGTLYPDLVVDGVAGDATVYALGQYLQRRSERALLRALNSLQGAYYIELAERREKDERFVYGWFEARISI